MIAAKHFLTVMSLQEMCVLLTTATCHKQPGQAKRLRNLCRAQSVCILQSKALACSYSDWYSRSDALQQHVCRIAPPLHHFFFPFLASLTTSPRAARSRSCFAR